MLVLAYLPLGEGVKHTPKSHTESVVEAQLIPSPTQPKLPPPSGKWQAGANEHDGKIFQVSDHRLTGTGDRGKISKPSVASFHISGGE